MDFNSILKTVFLLNTFCLAGNIRSWQLMDTCYSYSFPWKAVLRVCHVYWPFLYKKICFKALYLKEIASSHSCSLVMVHWFRSLEVEHLRGLNALLTFVSKALLNAAEHCLFKINSSSAGITITASLFFVVSSNCSFKDSEVEGLLNKFIFCEYIYTGRDIVTLIEIRLWNISVVGMYICWVVGFFFCF